MRERLRIAVLLALACSAPVAALAQSMKRSGDLALQRAYHFVTALPDGRVLAGGGRILFDTADPTPNVEIWDPATGKWTSTGRLITQRSHAQAFLLRNGRVLVPGGNFDFETATNTCEVWNPETGVWSSVGSLSMPHQVYAGVVLTDGRVWISGGTSPPDPPTAVCEVFNPATNAWSTTAPLPQERMEHRATLLRDGRVLVSGGRSGSTFIATSHHWNPATDTWTPTANAMASPRANHTMTLLPDGRVAVIGGCSSFNLFSACNGFPSSIEVWNPATNQWTSTGAMLNTARFNHVSTLLADGRIFIAGGHGSAGALASTEIYDPVANTCTLGPSISTPARELLQGVLLPTGAVLLVGGENLGGEVNVDLFDPAPGLLTNTGSMTETRYRASSASFRGGRVLVVGGAPSAAATPFASAELWTPAATGSSGTWSASGNMSVMRWGAAVSALPDGRVLAAGGSSNAVSTPNALASVETWNDGTWEPENPMSVARRDAGVTLLSDGRVMVAGGAGAGNVPLASTEAWGAGTWSTSGSFVTPRSGSRLTLLADGNVLASGGRGGTPLSSTELWDRATEKWTAVADLMSFAHEGHTATLLADGRVLVAGGSSGSAPLLNCEIFDPATKQWEPAGNLVTARWKHTATLLPDGRVMVYGGCADLSCTSVVGSAEIWDPAIRTIDGPWRQAGSGNPRADHVAGYAGARVLLAGGETGLGVSNGASIWSPAGPPPGVCRPSLSHFGSVGMPADPWFTGATIRGFGGNLTGCSEGTGGGTFASSAANHPQLRFLSLASGAVWDARYTRTRNWTATQIEFTVPGDRGLAPGDYLVQVVVNGIASAPKYARLLLAHEKHYLHRETSGITSSFFLDVTSPAAGGHGTPRDVRHCVGWTVGPEQQFVLTCTAALVPDYIYPPDDAGFLAERSISGTWTLRAEVASNGIGGGEAYLFARIRRHSDGALIHETERVRSLNLGTLGVTPQEILLHTVIPARENDVGICDGASTKPCASTNVPAGTWVRLEWWIDVVTAAPGTQAQIILEADGSTAASFPDLFPGSAVLQSPGPTGIAIRDLAAGRMRKGVEISWIAEPPNSISRMRVLRDEREIASVTPSITERFSVRDDAPDGGPYLLEVTRVDGAIQHFGPVRAESSARGCAVGGSGSLPALALLMLAIAATRRRA